MKRRPPWPAALMACAVLFARPGAAQNFTRNLKSRLFEPGRRSAILHASKAFRVTTKQFLNNEEVSLFRAAGGMLFIGVDAPTVVLLPGGESHKLVRGMVRYLPARGVGGGLRVLLAPGAKFAGSLEIEVSPGAGAAVPVPAAGLQAALRERGLRKIPTAYPAGFPPLPPGTPVASAAILDVPEAKVNLVTVERKATLSKLAHSSIWFVLGGAGNLSVSGKTYPLQPNSLLALPPGAEAITIAPAPAAGNPPAAGKSSGSAPGRLRILLVQHKTL